MRIIKTLVVVLLGAVLGGLVGGIFAGIVKALLTGSFTPESYGDGFFFMLFSVGGLVMSLVVSAILATRLQKAVARLLAIGRRAPQGRW